MPGQLLLLGERCVRGVRQVHRHRAPPMASSKTHPPVDSSLVRVVHHSKRLSATILYSLALVLLSYTLWFRHAGLTYLVNCVHESHEQRDIDHVLRAAPLTGKQLC